MAGCHLTIFHIFQSAKVQCMKLIASSSILDRPLCVVAFAELGGAA